MSAVEAFQVFCVLVIICGIILLVGAIFIPLTFEEADIYRYSDIFALNYVYLICVVAIVAIIAGISGLVLSCSNFRGNTCGEWMSCTIWRKLKRETTLYRVNNILAVTPVSNDGTKIPTVSNIESTEIGLQDNHLLTSVPVSVPTSVPVTDKYTDHHVIPTMSKSLQANVTIIEISSLMQTLLKSIPAAVQNVFDIDRYLVRRKELKNDVFSNELSLGHETKDIFKSVLPANIRCNRDDERNESLRVPHDILDYVVILSVDSDCETVGDEFQKEHECCGWDGKKDVCSDGIAPTSCCPEHEEISNCTCDKAFKSGCKTVFENALDSYILWIGILAPITALFVLLAMICLIVLMAQRSPSVC